MSMHIGPSLSPGRNAVEPARPRFASLPGWAARAGCAALLLAASPVMAVAAVGVLATSAGPMLTRSGRIGPDGQVVFLRQFRTTYRHEIGHGTLPGPRSVTPVGWVLRWSGIARLPMLADVWEGKVGLAALTRG